MPEYVISDKDLRDAENFLVQFQSEQVPEANLQEGGAVRDLLIKGFTMVYAFLRGEVDRVAARQSLLRIRTELTDDDDIAEAVDEILSNWFLEREAGQFAHLPARFHFTVAQDVSIPVSSRFWRTNSLIFYIDSDVDPYVITSQQMFPVFDGTGTLVDYVADVPMRAARTGEGYNVPPGKFVRTNVPGGLPYFSYVENTEESTDGLDVESSTDLIDRAESAITVRNLINNRSVDAVLRQMFPDISETLTIGMAEPEMVRDRRPEIGKHLQLHIGGHYDTYMTLPLSKVDETGIVGGFFVRPDNISNVFRDPELTHDLGRTFSTVLGVQPGHTLYLRQGITGAPRGFLITHVTDHELQVSENTPFAEPSDEKVTNSVTYSIGWLSPGFEEIELEIGVFSRTAGPSVTPAYANVPYGTSRRIQQEGVVVLSGKPVQDVLWVEITDPPGSSTLIDPTTGTLVFHNRINMLPAQQTEPQYTEYQVEVLNPFFAQSVEAVNLIRVGYGTDPPVFDGRTLRVVYKTLPSMSDIHTYVRNREHRTVSANQLVRGRHPVWIELVVPYKMKPTADTTLDEKSAAETLAGTINNFDPNDDLNVSDLSFALRDEYPDVGAVYDIEVIYYLNAPDGQQVFFTTEDLVSIFITEADSVTWENEDDVTIPPEISALWPPTITSAQKLQNWFEYLGVSDRTVRYLTLAEMISFESRD